MHVYPDYPAPSPRAVADLVRANPFALAVTATASSAPVATHLPVVPAPGTPADQPLEETDLWGHLGRANPHWRDLEAVPALFVFSGPHGYVSPTSYPHDPAVPTWNYAAVHVTGRVRLIDDDTAAMAVVEETVHALEEQRTPPWDPASSRGVFAKILPGIVAFTVEVLEVRSMFKLSQDMPATTRADVRAQFTAEGCPHLVDLMASVDPEVAR